MKQCPDCQNATEHPTCAKHRFTNDGLDTWWLGWRGTGHIPEPKLTFPENPPRYGKDGMKGWRAE